MALKRGRAKKLVVDRREQVFRGDRLRSLRDAKGWTQLEMAFRARAQPRQVSNCETGFAEPSCSLLSRFAIALGTSSDYLIGLTDSPNASK
jgi:transcriptional regulator with XRE-family HTH domain